MIILQDYLTLTDLLLWSAQLTEAVAEELEEMDEGEFMHQVVDNLRNGSKLFDNPLMGEEFDIISEQDRWLGFYAEQGRSVSSKPLQFQEFPQ